MHKNISILPLLLLLSCWPVDLFGEKIKVYVIISSECPICQYMGPELKGLSEQFKNEAELYLVFPLKNTNIKKASLYKEQFGLTHFKILMDEDQGISKKLGAKITPEAIILNSKEEVIYRGRINDTYISAGRRKHNASKRDLRLAMAQAINDESIPLPWPPAIGCYVTYQKKKM